MSTITRTLANIRRIGLKYSVGYIRITDGGIGDTKAGTLIGTDKYGNKYYENMTDELPLRTRWVDYKNHDYDPAQIEPFWHAWISYAVDKPPTEDPLTKTARSWAKPYHIPNWTLTRGAYKPYSTTKPKIDTWEPNAVPR
ncbi:NADH dehydrogenase [ubiquinone] 1 alpha subcomplex subunit N7BM [Cytospora mali]|uniref:NADH dehydrogenase [ubiquinone] 1 alpha subcomplex subunit n=1 Tax=Cytospora mali TaxID=578113 RepID=A0A194W4S3_CYTMA|nr:NADH dehydrogenase [ubiquinone] 1 alpha subcomplex subunit N7BM [Valsa mali]